MNNIETIQDSTTDTPPITIKVPTITERIKMIYKELKIINNPITRPDTQARVINRLNQQDLNGNNALMLAIIGSNKDLVQKLLPILLEKCYTFKNKESMSIHLLACKYFGSDDSVACKILSFRLHVHGKPLGISMINDISFDGNNALTYAYSTGKINLVNGILCTEHYNLQILNEINHLGETFLMQVCLRRDQQTAMYILRRKEFSMAFHTDVNGNSAFTIAVKFKLESVIIKLQEMYIYHTNTQLSINLPLVKSSLDIYKKKTLPNAEIEILRLQAMINVATSCQAVQQTPRQIAPLTSRQIASQISVQTVAQISVQTVAQISVQTAPQTQTEISRPISKSGRIKLEPLLTSKTTATSDIPFHPLMPVIQLTPPSKPIVSVWI